MKGRRIHYKDLKKLKSGTLVWVYDKYHDEGLYIIKKQIDTCTFIKKETDEKDDLDLELDYYYVYESIPHTYKELKTLMRPEKPEQPETIKLFEWVEDLDGIEADINIAKTCLDISLQTRNKKNFIYWCNAIKELNEIKDDYKNNYSSPF